MMKKTWKERTVSKCLAVAKKHKLWKGPMIAVIAVIVGICNIVTYFSINCKRYMVIACVFLCFVVSSSFCAPALVDHSMEESSKENIEGNEVALSSGVSQNEVLLDDDDVINELDETESYEMTDGDTYTLDEILTENDTVVADDEINSPVISENDVKNYDDFSFRVDDWRYVLINKQHPVPDDYTFILGTIKGNMKCDERILDDILLMLQGAKEDGVNLVICSPYRDYSRQKTLFERKIVAYMNRGYSYLDAYKRSSQAVTVPGASEHQIGMALDIVSNNYNTLDTGFGETAAGNWLREHAHEYGFVLRYPEGKEYITGIEYEPWHFRYVGVEAATLMADKEITLEEFWENYLLR